MIAWKDLAVAVGRSAPILGSLLGGPAGEAVGAIIASALGVAHSPDAVSQAIAANPDAAVKLATIESSRAIELEGLAVQHAAHQLAAETAALQATNTTMQAEASADHWPTYSWRPFLGFCVGFNTAASACIVLLVFTATIAGAAAAPAAVAQLPTVLGALAAISATVLPVLGIASYFRGKAQADPQIPTDNRG